MTSADLARRIALTAAASALMGMGLLTACGTAEKPAQTPTPPNSSANVSVSPTQKYVPGAITPGPKSGSGPANSYSPTAKARPAPTALPGNVITGG